MKSNEMRDFFDELTFKIDVQYFFLLYYVSDLLRLMMKYDVDDAILCVFENIDLNLCF